ncbi:carbohydrate ABC transporter substrate-binding protein, CUT1 family [Rhizobiales bacterium GAS191]|nr:carbohydrate ABC transporter substrate-binding protein, CUT1 family [Rhizobiales bacterium GAS113]SED32310.1 carbohydrate ABC transporter substrate-binding protein, CUT1 family [Rhizobiales bacterium GAS191]
MRSINRRSLLRAGLVGGAGALLSSPWAGSPWVSPAFAGDNVNLRVYWWGSQDRARRTLAVADLYRQHVKDLGITGEPTGEDYWPKLATQIVGRNMPDVFQLEPSTIADYSRRGACAPLDAYMGKELTIDAFGKNIVELCRVDGKVWGVGLGLNSFAMVYDADVFAKAGIAPPTEKTTWQDYAELCVALTKAVGREGYWGAPYGARYFYAFDVWLHQRGKGIFGNEGRGVGFTVDDATEWYSYWEDLRKRGGCVPPDVQALDQNLIESNALALGKSATGLVYSNQLIGYQSLSRNKLALATYPQKGRGAWGLYYRPALIWSIGVSSKNKEAAAAFINFFVNDLEAGKILGVERGVPLSPSVREAILPTLNETEQATVKYVSSLADKVVPYPAPAPKGANEFDRAVMRPVTDQLAFGKLSIAEAARRLVEDGNRVL